MEVKTKILNVNDLQHLVCFENGSSLTVSSEDMYHVINTSLKPIIKSDSPQPVFIIRIGHCSICGSKLKPYNTRRWKNSQGRPREICHPCLHDLLEAFAPRHV